MTSIIKVDTIQTAAGGTPTASSLGIGGTVGQIVSSTSDTAQSTTSTSYSTISGLSVNITPTSTSSKIYINYGIFAGTNNGYDECRVSLFRDSTDLKGSSNGTTRCPAFISGNEAYFKMQYLGFNYLDTPSTTSQITYSVKFQSQSGQTLYINSRGFDGSNWTSSSITVMEVLA